MRICLFYQCDTKSATENKSKNGIYILFPYTHTKGTFLFECRIWISKWFVCEVIYLIVMKWLERNWLYYLFMKIIKETQHIKHQSMIVFPCVKLFFYLFVCLFVCFAKEILEVNIFSVKYASFAFRKDHFGILSKNLFNEEKKGEKISMKSVIFLWKLPSFFLIIRKWKNELQMHSSNEFGKKSVFFFYKKRKECVDCFFFHVLSFCRKERRAM